MLSSIHNTFLVLQATFIFLYLTMSLPKTASSATNGYLQALGHLQSRLRPSMDMLEQSAESNVQHRVHKTTDPEKPLIGNGTTRKRSSSDSEQRSHETDSPSWLERQHLSQQSGTAQSPITIPDSPCPKRVRLSRGPGAQDRPILIIDLSGESSRDTTVCLEEQILQDPPLSPGTSSCSDRTLPPNSAQTTPRLSTEPMILAHGNAKSPRSRYTQHSALPSSPSLVLGTPFEPDVVVQEGGDVPRSHSIADILHHSVSDVPQSHAVSHDARLYQGNNEDWNTEVVLDSRRGRGRGGPVHYLVKSRGYDPDWRHWRQILPGSNELVIAFHRDHPDKPCPSVVTTLTKYPAPTLMRGDMTDNCYEAFTDDDSSDTDSTLS